jgi:hypothetical protein
LWIFNDVHPLKMLFIGNEWYWSMAIYHHISIISAFMVGSTIVIPPTLIPYILWSWLSSSLPKQLGQISLITSWIMVLANKWLIWMFINNIMFIPCYPDKLVIWYLFRILGEMEFFYYQQNYTYITNNYDVII